jgi:hypothetical protein
VKHDVSPWTEEITVFRAVYVRDEEGEGADRQPSSAGQRRRSFVLLTAFRRRYDRPAEAQIKMRPLALPKEHQPTCGNQTAEQRQIECADHRAHCSHWIEASGSSQAHYGGRTVQYVAVGNNYNLKAQISDLRLKSGQALMTNYFQFNNFEM